MIQEKYYLTTDEASYTRFIADQAYELEKQNEMIIIEGCMMLMEFEEKYGIELKEYRKSLAGIGIEGDLEQIINLIKQKRMKYRFEQAQKKEENKKTAKNDFYKFLSQASKQLGYRITSDILLAEWCGILSDLKESNNGRSNKKRRYSED